MQCCIYKGNGCEMFLFYWLGFWITIIRYSLSETQTRNSDVGQHCWKLHHRSEGYMHHTISYDRKWVLCTLLVLQFTYIYHSACINSEWNMVGHFWQYGAFTCSNVVQSRIGYFLNQFLSRTSNEKCSSRERNQSIERNLNVITSNLQIKESKSNSKSTNGRKHNSQYMHTWVYTLQTVLSLTNNQNCNRASKVFSPEITDFSPA